MKPLITLASTLLLLVSCSPHDKIDVPEESGDETAFTIHAEVDAKAGNSRSTLLLCLTEGDNKKDYRLTLLIDDDLIEDETAVDFSENPLVSISLPLLRPGEHTADIEILCGETSKKESLSFAEPQRVSQLILSVYNDNGQYMLSVGDNPYNLQIDISSTLTITGKCNYWEGASSWIYGYPSQWNYYKSSSKSCKDTRDIDTDQSGLFTLADRDALAQDVTSSYVFSALWRTEVDSEGTETSYVTGYQPVYYEISSETLELDGSIEKVDGVTIKISSTISNTTFNGKALSSSPISL